MYSILMLEFKLFKLSRGGSHKVCVWKTDENTKPVLIVRTYRLDGKFNGGIFPLVFFLVIIYQAIALSAKSSYCTELRTLMGTHLQQKDSLTVIHY